jgi:hypothetical protein
MAEDEERFMNRPLIASAGVEEVILSQGNRADSDGSRTAILVQGPAEADDLRSRLMGWAAGFARDLAGVSVDFISSWTELAFPATAVMWLPSWHEQCAVPSGLSAKILLVRHMETPRSRLLG